MCRSKARERRRKLSMSIRNEMPPARLWQVATLHVTTWCMKCAEEYDLAASVVNFQRSICKVILRSIFCVRRFCYFYVTSLFRLVLKVRI